MPSNRPPTPPEGPTPDVQELVDALNRHADALTVKGESTEAQLARLGVGAAPEVMRLAAKALRSTPPAQAGACKWTEDPDDCKWWDTDCGEAFQFMDGGPPDNSMAFCCYCGKALDAPPPPEARDE